MTGLVLRISTVKPLPAQVIAAGCRDADVELRDQSRGPVYVAAGRRFAIVPASAVAS